jgi:DNA-binding GntR family transcriptional regulator
MAENLKSTTKTDLAFQTLRAAIEEGRLKPGERLTMAHLPEELGMSPTPIREAMRLLQAEGLLEHQPHRGVVVRSFPAAQVEEVFRLRVLLEPLATELAVERVSAEQIAEIWELHNGLAREVAQEPAQTNVSELNARWHRAIYDASGSSYLNDFIARLWLALPVRAIWLTRRAAHSVAQHGEIMAAIDARESGRAAELMREHVAFGAVTTGQHLRAIESAN